MEEIWKDVKGYEGLYLISNIGRVRIVSSGKIKKHKVLKGYHKFNLSKDNKKVWSFAHRLVAYAFLPKCEHGLEINHIDGVKSNNYILNLEWVSHKENIDHSWRIGLKNIGNSVYNKGRKASIDDYCGTAKLDLSDVIKIKHSSLKNVELHKIYGISQSQISRIKSGKRWERIA